MLTKVLSNEKGYYHSFQMSKMRLKNFFCTAFFIKKNYVVDYVKTQTIKYPETIFYKFFKVYCNIKVINRRSIMLALGMYGLYKVVSYKLSIVNSIVMDNVNYDKAISERISKLF